MYWGWCAESGETFHASYHEDGNRFWIISGKPEPLGPGPKLSEFKGVLQLVNISWIGIEKIPMSAPYRFNRSDSVVYIDMRTFGEKGVNMDLLLLEPFRLDSLNPFYKSFWRNSQLHVFTSVEPWIVIAYRSQASLQEKRELPKFSNVLHLTQLKKQVV